MGGRLGRAIASRPSISVPSRVRHASLAAMRRAHQGLQLGLMAAFVAAAPLARANGRFPQAQQLLQSPADAERLWLRATYGILSSSDRSEERRVGEEGIPASGQRQRAASRR